MNTAIVVMMMNYFHDLASGLFFGSVVAYYLTIRVLRRTLTSGADEVIQAVRKQFRPVVLTALALVILGGFPRAYFYEQYEWLPAAGRDQVPALIAKHVVLVSITISSLVFFLRGGTEGPTKPEE